MKQLYICETVGKFCLTQRDAGGIVNNLKKGSVHHNDGDIPKRHYYCIYCGFHHLTHYPTYHPGYRAAKRRRLYLLSLKDYESRISM